MYVNAKGHVIKEREYSDREYKKLCFLNSLKLPDDKKLIMHLSGEDFRTWIYGMNPKEAFLLYGNDDMKEVVENLTNKNSFSRVMDAIWRLWHGYFI